MCWHRGLDRATPEQLGESAPLRILKVFPLRLQGTASRMCGYPSCSSHADCGLAAPGATSGLRLGQYARRKVFLLRSLRPRLAGADLRSDRRGRQDHVTSHLLQPAPDTPLPRHAARVPSAALARPAAGASPSVPDPGGPLSAETNARAEQGTLLGESQSPDSKERAPAAHVRIHRGGRCRFPAHRSKKWRQFRGGIIPRSSRVDGREAPWAATSSVKGLSDRDQVHDSVPAHQRPCPPPSASAFRSIRFWQYFLAATFARPSDARCLASRNRSELHQGSLPRHR